MLSLNPRLGQNRIKYKIIDQISSDYLCAKKGILPSLRQNTSLSAGTDSASSESKGRFPVGSLARAVPAGVYAF